MHQSHDPLTVLPLEVAIQVLYQGFPNGHDLCFLWTELRNVSKSWRRMVEEYVQKKHLPKTSIVFYPGYHRFPDHDDSQLDVCFEFDRLKENDPNTAILAEKQAKTKHKAVSMQELRQHMLVVRPMNYWPRPPQVVQVRRHANDTEVPRFQVDWDKEEAQCDWRGLFTALYSEDKLATTLTRRMNKHRMPPWSPELLNEINAGESDMMKVMQTMLKQWAEMYSRNLKLARRKRIERQFMRDCGDEYVPYFGDDDEDSDEEMGSEEAVAVEELHEINSTLAWGDFSDEEEDMLWRSKGATESENEDNAGSEDDWVSTDNEVSDDGGENHEDVDYIVPHRCSHGMFFQRSIPEGCLRAEQDPVPSL